MRFLIAWNSGPAEALNFQNQENSFQYLPQVQLGPNLVPIHSLTSLPFPQEVAKSCKGQKDQDHHHNENNHLPKNVPVESELDSSV